LKKLNRGANVLTFRHIGKWGCHLISELPEGSRWRAAADGLIHCEKQGPAGCTMPELVDLSSIQMAGIPVIYLYSQGAGSSQKMGFSFCRPQFLTYICGLEMP
jgi:hypothetical protein